MRVADGCRSAVKRRLAKMATQEMLLKYCENCNRLARGPRQALAGKRQTGLLLQPKDKVQFAIDASRSDSLVRGRLMVM